MTEERGKHGMTSLMRIAGEERGLVILSCLLAAVSAILMIVPYVAVYYIIRELMLLKGHIPSLDRAWTIGWGAVSIAAVAAGLATAYLSGLASHIAAFRILRSLRTRLAEHVGKLPLGYLNRKSTGAVNKGLESNVEKVELFVAHQLPDFVQMVVTLLAIITAMAVMHGWLALAALLPLILGFAAQWLAMGGTKARQYVKGYHDALENMNNSAVQYVKGMPAIRMFGHSAQSFRRFHEDIMAYQNYCLAYTDRYKHGYLVFKVLMSSFAAFILPAGLLAMSGEPDSLAFAAVMLFFLVMAPGIAAPAFKLLFLSSSLQDIQEGAERMERVFQERPLPEPAAPRQPVGFDVEFDRVGFRYDTSEQGGGQAALTDVSFRAEQGRMTAVVGPSGAGKSTIASLLPRFWDVQQGSIRIGGVDIREMETSQLMDTVSFVFQETYLFHDTVYHNIAMGRTGSSKEEVRQAAEAAQCDSLIRKLPQGYDTVIGEGGVHLSGGEQQRIAVARAILKNAPSSCLTRRPPMRTPKMSMRCKPL